LLTGDPASTRQFVDEWQPRIAGWISRFCPSGAVEDYAQEVLSHLAQDGWRRLGSWRGLDAERSNPNSLAAYIKKITISKAIDLLKADRRQLPHSGEPFDIVDETGLLGMDPMESAEGRSLMAAIKACFDEVQRGMFR
jgi:DNA-directed RNA polymerase specialized sigma24 family protein